MMSRTFQANILVIFLINKENWNLVGHPGPSESHDGSSLSVAPYEATSTLNQAPLDSTSLRRTRDTLLQLPPAPSCGKKAVQALNYPPLSALLRGTEAGVEGGQILYFFFCVFLRILQPSSGLEGNSSARTCSNTYNTVFLFTVL